MDAFSPDRLAAAEQQAGDRLRELHNQLIRSNDHLYQHLALYLQVLREGLLPLVQQACFHLITTAPAGSASTTTPSQAGAYAALSDNERLRFQEQIRQLVERCCCLLTVEQLVALAAQRQQQEQKKREQRRQDFLEVMQNSSRSGPDAESSSEPNPAPPRGTSSVHLGLDLPISADLFTQGLPGLAGLSAETMPAAAPAEPEADAVPEEPTNGSATPSALEAGPSQEDPPLGPAAMPGVEALMALASASADLFSALADEAADPADADHEGLLPRDPEKLLQWWDQWDQALLHRLRHLSHALNGLMVRSGMSRTLLPATLLEAVLHGQLEPLPAPANLVRLPIPVPPMQGAAMERLETMMAVLLRPSDLEFEHPPLRTCRQRLDHHRRQVRRMAQHYRDWQRRHQSIQAQRLWEQDINGIPNPPAAGS